MRKYYLDNLRSMTVVFVVVYHVLYMYNNIVTAGVLGSNQSHPIVDGVQYVLYPWFMVLLFMIAGMCSRYYLGNHTEQEFLRSRTRKLLVPSTLGLLIIGPFQGYISMSISNAFSTIGENVPKFVLFLIMTVSGTGVLWFIQVLWLNSLLLYFMRKFETDKFYEKTKNSGVVAFIICGILYYGAGQIFNTPIISVYRFGIYAYAFFLGYFILAHEEVIYKLQKCCWILFVAAVILAWIYLHLHFGDNYAVMPVVGCASASAYGYVISLAVLGLGKRYMDKMNSFTTFMHKRNFSLYIFHYLPLSAMALFMERWGMIPQSLRYIIILMAAFGGSFVLHETVTRIPGLRWLVLGIKKEK